jgi:hypothetical protein
VQKIPDDSGNSILKYAPALLLYKRYYTATEIRFLNQPASVILPVYQ